MRRWHERFIIARGVNCDDSDKQLGKNRLSAVKRLMDDGHRISEEREREQRRAATPRVLLSGFIAVRRFHTGRARSEGFFVAILLHTELASRALLCETPTESWTPRTSAHKSMGADLSLTYWQKCFQVPARCQWSSWHCAAVGTRD
jgi:hypothetical protein